MFDTSFLQVLVLGVAGALLVGPKDLPVVARKFGGLLGKGVGLVGRTRTSVQSFIKEHELTHVQQDFERSLQQIRQVQDEVKQGLTSPITQTIHRHPYTNYAMLNDPAQVHTPISPSSSSHVANKFETRIPSGEELHSSNVMYVMLCNHRINA